MNDRIYIIDPFCSGFIYIREWEDGVDLLEIHLFFHMSNIIALLNTTAYVIQGHKSLYISNG